jgi:hypothetical protein
MASKFDVFTRLARREGKPPAERQLLPDGAWRAAAFARQRTHRFIVLVRTVILTACAAIVVLSFT